MNGILIRKYYSNQTLGNLLIFNELEIAYKCMVLELPYRDNLQRLSCIPEGKYQVFKHESPKFGDCFWIHDVPGREEILIHAGNYTRNTLGCLLPGRAFVKMDSDNLWDVNYSRNTLQVLLGMMPDEFSLKITSV